MFVYRNHDTGQTVRRRERSRRFDVLSEWELVEESGPSEHAAPAAPGRPGKGDAKSAWVAYVAATSDLSEAEAEDMTKAELIELADNEQ